MNATDLEHLAGTWGVLALLVVSGIALAVHLWRARRAARDAAERARMIAYHDTVCWPSCGDDLSTYPTPPNGWRADR